MNNLLNNKTILVAGACGLLGSRIVKGALEQGANIIAADIDSKRMQKLLFSLNIEKDTPSLKFLEVDITDENSVRGLFSKFDHLDGAVNATYPRNSTYGAHFFDVTLSSFNENLAMHLGSAFLFSQQCAAYFENKKTPFSLVNISSIYGVVAPDFSIYENTPMTMPIEYAAIKSGLLHINKYISKYINNSDFRINAVSPGGIFDSQPQAFLRAYKGKTMGTGMLDVSDIIASILFLLSEQSKYIVGQNLIVDDGFSL